jgi:hypothetical protein
LTLARPDLTFVIRAADVNPHLVYPHGGCNVEVYTSSNYLEMETLGPLTGLAYGQGTVHRQQWQVLAPSLELLRIADVPARARTGPSPIHEWSTGP